MTPDPVDETDGPLAQSIKTAAGSDESSALTHARAYDAREGPIKEVIDACADHPHIDQYGAKAELAREIGVDPDRVYYVMDRWEDLVKWRRHANLDPLDPAAVKAAYEDEDETVQALAMDEDGQPEVLADGVGNMTVKFELELNEAFRALRQLHGDIGFKVFAQIIANTEDIPPSGIDALFDR